MQPVDENGLTTYDRSRPHLNIGVIGHAGHGKTTLTSAITKLMADRHMGKYYDIQSLDKAPIEKQINKTLYENSLEFQTSKRHYAFFDCPGSSQYAKNALSSISKMDAAILVVSAPDGPMPQTREHILFCRQMKAKTIIVFVNKIDLINDKELDQVVELEIRQVLASLHYEGKKTIVVKGSAKYAIEGTNSELGMNKIEELINVFEESFQDEKRQTTQPFMMFVDKSYNIPEKGVVATGLVERGRVNKGDEIEFYGYGSKIKANVKNIQTFHKNIDFAQAGDYVGILLEGLDTKQIHRRLVMAAPGSLTPVSSFQANTYWYKKENGGRHKPFKTGYRPQLFLKTVDCEVKVELPQGFISVNPGDNLMSTIQLSKPIIILEGQRFILREGGRSVAAGVVNKILVESP